MDVSATADALREHEKRAMRDLSVLQSVCGAEWPVIVSWSAAVDDGDAVVTGYAVYVDNTKVKELSQSVTKV